MFSLSFPRSLVFKMAVTSRSLIACALKHFIPVIFGDQWRIFTLWVSRQGLRVRSVSTRSLVPVLISGFCAINRSGV